MSYYQQGYYDQQQQQPPAAQQAGLNFIPTQFGTPSYNNSPSSAISGSMRSAVPSSSYAYGEPQSDRLSTGLFAAFSTSGYAGEPPLLEGRYYVGSCKYCRIIGFNVGLTSELGVNFSHIQSKTMAVLNPFGTIDQNIMDDSDLAGPIFFFLLFGTFLLLSGKVHFGYVYGIALIGTLAQYIILNLMALKSIDFTRTASVLGYCLLPLVATSALGVVLSLDNAFGYSLSCLIIVWCTYASSGIFVSYLQLSEMRALVAYPLALFYAVFSVMTLFAEKTSIA